MHVCKKKTNFAAIFARAMKKHILKLWAVLFAAMLLQPAEVHSAPPTDGGREPVRPHVRTGVSGRQQIGPAARSVGQINIAPRGLLIMAEFSDNSFQPENPKKAIDSLANGSGYKYNGASGSIKEYFEAQSDGQYHPHFDVVGPVKLPQTIEWYGANRGDTQLDRYTADFVIDAVEAADKEGVDFSIYDNDNDGVIDFVYIIYAGFGEADGGGASTIWPHNWDMMSNFYYGYSYQTKYYYKNESDYLLPEYDGKKLNDYACSSELRKGGSRNGIGVICHEFSHVLGLPDYYLSSNNATMPLSTTPGSWSLMGYGCYLDKSNTPCNLSVYDKYYLGWSVPTPLADTQNVVIPADGKTFYAVTRDCQKPEADAQTEDTVYYIENRQYTGWDKYLPGHGLIVWQVVYDSKMWLDNTPNDFSTRYLLVTANGTAPYTSDTSGGTREGVPFPGRENVTTLGLFNHKIEDISEQSDGVHLKFVAGKTHTALNGTTAPRQPEKRIENGRIVIDRGGKKFDITGREVR